jgi:hypothetical protein
VSSLLFCSLLWEARLAFFGRWLLHVMLDQVELFCKGHAEYQQCLNAQKEALVRIVRISEEHPLETNQKAPECMTSGRNALGRTDFIKASSCLDAESRKE